MYIVESNVDRFRKDYTKKSNRQFYNFLFNNYSGDVNGIYNKCLESLDDDTVDLKLSFSRCEVLAALRDMRLCYQDVDKILANATILPDVFDDDSIGLNDVVRLNVTEVIRVGSSKLETTNTRFIHVTDTYGDCKNIIFSADSLDNSFISRGIYGHCIGEDVLCTEKFMNVVASIDEVWSYEEFINTFIENADLDEALEDSFVLYKRNGILSVRQMSGGGGLGIPAITFSGNKNPLLGLKTSCSVESFNSNYELIAVMSVNKFKQIFRDEKEKVRIM